MNKKNPILTLISVVLIFLLFTPIVLCSLQSFAPHPDSIQFTKSKGSPVKTDSQTPFEEREKEDKTVDDVNDPSPTLFIEHSFIPFPSSTLKVEIRVAAFGFFANTPLYLAKRSLLI
jgi:hypothetical protein